jgi:hypothetical protein
MKPERLNYGRLFCFFVIHPLGNYLEEQQSDLFLDTP